MNCGNCGDYENLIYIGSVGVYCSDVCRTKIESDILVNCCSCGKSIEIKNAIPTLFAGSYYCGHKCGMDFLHEDN